MMPVYFTARQVLYLPEAASAGDSARPHDVTTTVITNKARIVFFMI
jgi:hypothetical protein